MPDQAPEAGRIAEKSPSCRRAEKARHLQIGPYHVGRAVQGVRRVRGRRAELFGRLLGGAKRRFCDFRGRGEGGGRAGVRSRPLLSSTGRGRADFTGTSSPALVDPVASLRWLPAAQNFLQRLHQSGNSRRKNPLFYMPHICDSLVRGAALCSGLAHRGAAPAPAPVHRTCPRRRTGPLAPNRSDIFICRPQWGATWAKQAWWRSL